MGTPNSKRFDHNHAAQLFLDIAHENSLDRLFRKLAENVTQRPEVVAGQAWLVDKGDLCTTCSCRPVCPDQARCLHLAMGKGIPEQEPMHFDESTRRAPLGVGLLGKVATGKESLFTNLESGQLLGIDLPPQHDIRWGTAAPIIFKGEVLGVAILFARDDIQNESLPWIRIFADYLGAAIANARAFEEIQRLKAQLEQQNAYLQEEVQEAKAFGDLVGRSGALRQLVRQIDLVACTQASVLIQGETGTGKELVAREIHRRSDRKEGPLVRVNCASIPKELFESEFFGHIRGSFTGAVRDRAGRFETAQGGTIFLDEVGEIPLDMQGKLLRVLQEKRYERVGEDRTRVADVRVLSATNQDLKQAVAEGRFREDLYYRLHVFPVHVLPLRERKEDIPLLAAHFIDLSVKELRCPKPRLTKAAMAVLEGYHWPGNIRELRNVIERAVILARGGPLYFDLPVATAREGLERPSSISLDDGGELRFYTEIEVQLFERQNLLTLLRKTGWKISGPNGAAELMGVKPTTLISRIERMGLKRPRD